MASKPVKQTDTTEKPAEVAKGVQWREDTMATQFANVVNVQGTREQVDLFFGTNRTWHSQENGAIEVELSNRIILTPLAAKRLLTVLNGVLREHEKRYGALEIE